MLKWLASGVLIGTLILVIVIIYSIPILREKSLNFIKSQSSLMVDRIDEAVSLIRSRKQGTKVEPKQKEPTEKKPSVKKDESEEELKGEPLEKEIPERDKRELEKVLEKNLDKP